MSDSELSEPPATNSPPDVDLESSLRAAVAKTFKAGKAGEMTVNGMRKTAEDSLGLEQGFFDSHPTWKAESKRVVKDEHVEHVQIVGVRAPRLTVLLFQAKLEAEGPSSSAPQPKDVQRKEKASKSKPAKPPSRVKRGSPDQDDEIPSKRRKKVKSMPDADASEELSSLLSDLSEDSFEPDAKPKLKSKTQTKNPVAKKEFARRSAPKSRTKVAQKSRKVVPIVEEKSQRSNGAPKGNGVMVNQESDSELSEAPGEPIAKNDGSLDPVQSESKPDDSGSELSVVLDDEPKSMKKHKSLDKSEMKAKKGAPTKAKVNAEADPDDAEIKRLQGWLVKCGIRKLWGKELKPFGTSKTKIKHLKDMLSEAGMTGRYSIEKANQIKEARELAADIEAVQEGAQRWGKEDSESENNDNQKSKRRLVRGAKNYDFLSSDGEETD